MKIIPVVFCFDDKMEFPAGVCITSLLANANSDTFYDIFILYSDKCTSFHETFDDLVSCYDNCRITYRTVGNEFEQAFEIRGITVAAYYRLLIPKLIPEYDKIMYFDVDVIFRNDLSSFYEQIDLDGFYVGGVSTPYSDITGYVRKQIGMDITEYICSGTIVINSKKIREDGLVDRFKDIAMSTKWKYQDQDTLNIVCRGKIKILPPWFGMVGTVCEILSDTNQKYYSEEEAEYARKHGIIHYNGPKPWKQYCLNFDIWWEYYRKSIFFDPKFYYDFYLAKMNEYDLLPFWKRVKILLRYFKIGYVLKK